MNKILFLTEVSELKKNCFEFNHNKHIAKKYNYH